MIYPDFPTIKDGDVVSFDTETNGVDWQTCHIVGFVITLPDRDFNAYYPIRHETGPNMDPAKVIKWVKSWADKKITIVGHNLKFDLHMCANDGIFFPNAQFEDTQINANLIDEHMGKYSLDAVAKDLEVPVQKGTDIYDYICSMFPDAPKGKNSMSHFWRLPADDVRAHDYAMADGEVTYLCRQIQNAMIVEQKLERVWRTESDLIPVLMRMERRGVPVDMDNLSHLKGFINRKLEAANAYLPEGFNVRSPNQMAELMINKEGLTREELPQTALGNLSFTETWLKNYDTGRAVINVRKLTNLINSFITGSVENKLYKGRIHTNFNQMFDGEYGTVTGRLSSNGPNMQQVPKRDKLLAPIFRRIFVPEADTFWSTNDYSQQEYRIFAMYTGSEAIIEAYRQGRDMHQTVADELKVERDPTAKRLNLGMLYWMGALKLSGQLGVTLEVAKGYRRSYDARLPEVKQFLDYAKWCGDDKGYVLTILGRRQRFPDRNKTYQGASRIIQGTCADIVKQKMVEVDKYLTSETNGEFGLVLQVHDSLDWFLPPDLMALDVEARRIMGDMSTISSHLDAVPMKVDFAHGPSWGHASFPNQDWGIYDKEISGSELSDEDD